MTEKKRKHIEYSDYDYVTSNKEKPTVYAVSNAFTAVGLFLAFSLAYRKCIPMPTALFAILIISGILISGTVSFLLQLGKMPKKAVAVPFILITAVIIIAGVKRLYGGVLGIINCHIELWNEYYNDGRALFKSSLISDYGINAVTVIIAVLCVMAVVYLVKYKNALLTLLAIAVSFLPTLVLDRFSPIAFSLAIASLWAITMEKMKSADAARRMGWILFFATASLIFAVVITGTHAQVTQNMKHFQQQVISNVRFGDDSLPEGDLSKASDMLKGSKERLIVTSEYGRDLYLRGFVGAKYENGKWQELKNSAYGSGNSSIINWLSDRDFTAQYQYNSYVKNSEKSFDSNNITIENTGAQRNYIYLPYSAAPFSKGSTYIEGDLNTKSSAFFGASSYDFCEQSDIKPTELYTLDSWYASPETEQEKEYKESETVYRKFVYENYLSVDEKNKDEINTLFWSKANKTEKENLLSAIEHIRDTLEENCEYNESCDYVKQSHEPLSDFLFTYQVGNSCLFASAAVEALRCAGFPARYAEGYLLKNSEKLEETVTLTTDDAHAWAEVYMDGVGWLPVDFTPGFYYDTYALVSLVNAPNESKAVSNNPNGDSGSHNFSTDKTNITKRKTEKAKKHDIYILIGILTALVLLIFTVLSVIKIQKIIRVSKLRRTIEKAEPKKRQEYICRLIFELLRLDSIPVTLGRNAEKTARLIEEKHPEIKADEYLRINEITEKFKYAEVMLEKYEEKTLTAFVEKYVSAIENNSTRRINILSKINIE